MAKRGQKHEVYDFNVGRFSGGGSDAAQGAAFASAIWGEPQFVASAASIPERESVSPIEMQIEDESERANRRLMERAQALAAYRAPKPAKKREGGADEEGEESEEEALDGGAGVEAEFLAALEGDGAGQRLFVEPDDVELSPRSDDESEGAPRRAAAQQFTVPEIWDDVEFRMRKDRMTENLAAAADKIRVGQEELPKVRVDNERIRREIQKLKDEMERFRKQEEKLMRKKPELAQEKAKLDAAKASLVEGPVNPDVKKRRALEKANLRKARRRRQKEAAVEHLDRLQRSDGAEMVGKKGKHGQRSAIRGWYSKAATSMRQFWLTANPYRPALDSIKLLLPRCAVYFKVLQFQIASNLIFLPVIIPQLIAWIWNFGGRSGASFSLGGLPVPASFLYSSMPSKAFDYIDVATVYIAVFATCYTIKYITVVRRLAYDLKALELEFYTDAEDTSAMFKYSRIVFTSWTLEVHSQAQKQDLAREMVHQLKYLRDLNSPDAQDAEEEWTTDSDAEREEDRKAEDRRARGEVRDEGAAEEGSKEGGTDEQEAQAEGDASFAEQRPREGSDEAGEGKPPEKKRKKKMRRRRPASGKSDLVAREKGGAEAEGALTLGPVVLLAVRVTCVVLYLGVVIGAWVIIELLVSDALLQYPRGAERLISPAIAGGFNVWVIPPLTQFAISTARVAHERRVSVNLCAVLLARTINIVIIIRRQWTTLADTTRVYVPAKMLDTCYCEDEVGANLFWFWLADSLAVQAKVLLAPALYRAYALVTRSRKLRPTFHLASWLIDDVVSQMLLILALPLVPVTALLAVALDALSFVVKRYALVHLWDPPPVRAVFSPVFIRVCYSAAASFGLVCVTTGYYFFWVHGATAALPAPVCQLPVLAANHSAGHTACTLDPVTGAAAAVPCAAYGAGSAGPCLGRSFAADDLPLFHLASGAARLAPDTYAFEVVALPVFPWALFFLAAVASLVQRHYRRKFAEHVDETRYRLRVQLAGLERTITRLDKMLALQRSDGP